jgi:hypothetical protein
VSKNFTSGEPYVLRWSILQAENVDPGDIFALILILLFQVFMNFTSGKIQVLIWGAATVPGVFSTLLLDLACSNSKRSFSRKMQ